MSVSPHFLSTIAKYHAQGISVKPCFLILITQRLTGVSL